MKLVNFIFSYVLQVFSLAALLSIFNIACNFTNSTNTLTLETVEKPKSLDPRIGNDGVSARLHQIIFNTLVNKNERLEIVPELAIFEISPDKKKFTFYLKPNIKFHNGQILTSADVKYTFDTLRAENFKSPKKGDFTKVVSIDTPDPQTVIFRCSSPNAQMLVSLVAIGIIPKDSGDIAATQPIGSGPFKVVDYLEDSDITLEANPFYFDGPPEISKLRIRFIPDATVRELELRQGSIQLAINPDMSSDIIEKLGQAPHLKLLQEKGSNISYINLNCDDGILKNVKVRQALAFAIDKSTILKNVLRGMARLANGPLPPEQWAYSEELPRFEFNIAQAKKLLDEAGYTDPDGDGPQPRFNLELKTSSNALARQVASIIQEQYRNIGIELKIKSFEFQTFLNDVISGNYQLAGPLIFTGANQHPDFLSYLYESTRIPTKDRSFSEGANRSHYRNFQVDEWLKQASDATDTAVQRRLYSLVQKKVTEEVPQIFLWYPNNIAIMRDQVENVQLDLSGSYLFLKNVKLKS